jgi:nicotinamidase-related amidase
MEQMLWPVFSHYSILTKVHCVQGTKGVEFVEGLDLSGINLIIEKGKEKLVEAYSAFTDPWGLFPSKLENALVEAGITDVFVVGLGIWIGELANCSGGFLCQVDCFGC